LTERHLSIIPLGESRDGKPPVHDDELRAVEAVAGIKLSFLDTGDALRIEGLDGVGREIARRCLTKMLRRPLAGVPAVTQMARRAALMHDIGKALTHELDGSHAVIGADYARRLGETELVANAIGAHHTDEPFSSPYAYLVAAADAMSGARPGARRQTEDNHVA